MSVSDTRGTLLSERPFRRGLHTLCLYNYTAAHIALSDHCHHQVAHGAVILCPERQMIWPDAPQYGHFEWTTYLLWCEHAWDNISDSKVYGANMGPTWGREDWIGKLDDVLIEWGRVYMRNTYWYQKYFWGIINTHLSSSDNSPAHRTRFMERCSVHHLALPAPSTLEDLWLTIQ